MVSWTDVSGLTCLLVGVVLTTIAIPTQEWTTYGGSTLGLWRICPSQGGCSDVDDSDDLDAVRAMVLMGDIIALLGVIVMLVAFVLEAARDMTSRWTQLVVAGAALLAGALVLAGVIVYTINIHDDLQTTSDKDKGYSFWLAIAALIILFIAAFILIVGTVLQEHKRRRLASKTKELREKSRAEEFGFRKSGRGRVDVPRPYSAEKSNNYNQRPNGGYQNGYLPKGNSDPQHQYRRRHRSASPVRRNEDNIVWDRYQHKYVPRLVPVTTVLPDSQYFDPRYGLPLGTYHHVDPVGPRGYISYVGRRPSYNGGHHRRSPSGGYPGVHSLTDWRRQERSMGQVYTPYSEPTLYH